MASSFIDTRFHIHVRSALEYRIPECGNALLLVTVGESCHSQACKMLETLNECLQIPASESIQVDGDPELDNLVGQMCTDLMEFLEALSSEWKRHLRDAANKAQRIVSSTTDAYNEAIMVRNRYVQRNPTLVEEEFNKERASLLRGLTERMEKVRTDACPEGKRPGALIMSAELLKEAFASSHTNAVSSATIHASKYRFHNEMRRIEREVAEDFVRFGIDFIKASKKQTS